MSIPFVVTAVIAAVILVILGTVIMTISSTITLCRETRPLDFANLAHLGPQVVQVVKWCKWCLGSLRAHLAPPPPPPHPPEKPRWASLLTNLVRHRPSLPGTLCCHYIVLLLLLLAISTWILLFAELSTRNASTGSSLQKPKPLQEKASDSVWLCRESN